MGIPISLYGVLTFTAQCIPLLFFLLPLFLLVRLVLHTLTMLTLTHTLTHMFTLIMLNIDLSPDFPTARRSPPSTSSLRKRPRARTRARTQAKIETPVVVRLRVRGRVRLLGAIFKNALVLVLILGRTSFLAARVSKVFHSLWCVYAYPGNHDNRSKALRQRHICV